MIAQDVLLWQRPIALVAIVLPINALLFWAYLTRMGLFALFIVACFAAYLGVLVGRRFQNSGLLGPASGNRGLRSFEQICTLLAFARQKLALLADFLLGNLFEISLMKIGCVLLIWVTLAFVFHIVGNFWLFMVLINAALLVPGALDSRGLLPGAQRSKVD